MNNIMSEEASKALKNHIPFSSVENKEIMYWGRDRKIISMMINQIKKCYCIK